jgi:dolichol-phosphate mannosyltransferase
MNDKNDKRIIAIIPALNEEGKIGKVVAKFPENIVDEILVVDDGSTDSTAQEAKKAGAKIISHKTKSGVGAAIRTGIDYALNKDYDIVVIMGGDDQDNPDEIPLLIDPIINDGYDFVQGSRRLDKGKMLNIPLFRRITTKYYSWLFRLLVRFPITDGTNGFRAFKLTIFNNPNINLWQNWLNTYELEPYLYYKVIKLGFKVKEVGVTKRYPKTKRISYTKMIPFLDWWRITKPLIYLKLGIRK